MRDQIHTDIASVSVASKERLAKLLATENIMIEHRNVPTAGFDVKNRVLVLPMWKDVSPALYDLLVGHEDGHALWTPFEGWHGACEGMSPGYRSFLNVIEDARIEKKIKRKFPGIRKSFIEGYQELLDRNFFGLDDRDVNSMGLIDRINIHFKGGSMMGVLFTDAEKVYVDRIAKAETWDEVKAIADDLWEEAQDDDAGAMTNPGHTGEPGDDDDGEGFAPSDDSDDSDDDDTDGEFGNPGDVDGESDSNDDAPKGNTPTDTDGDDDNDGDSDDATNPGNSDNGSDSNDDDADADANGTGNASGENNDADADDDSDDDDDAESKANAGDGAGKGGPGVDHGEPFSETDKAFRENESKLVEDEDGERTEIQYVTIPKDAAFNLSEIIIPPKTIHDALHHTASKEQPLKVLVNEFKKANSKVVNYLAKEFEMRKAADASARATTARTGVLDVNTLHSYKWNDDVFKKITNIPDGKSHGLVMFLDWSGSMASSMAGSIDQVLNLALFCKKVNIPFDVYAFSDGVYDQSRYRRDDENDDSPASEHLTGPDRDPTKAMTNRIVNGDFTLAGSNQRFALLHFLSSDMKNSAWNHALEGMMVLKDSFGSYYRSSGLPPWLNLHGTPLNDAILAAMPVVNKFRTDHGLQIVNTVFLTDGCGSELHVVHNATEVGGRRYSRRAVTIIRDPITRREYKQDAGRYSYRDGDAGGESQMAILLDILRGRTGSNVVNFYIANPRPSNFKREMIDRMILTDEDKEIYRRGGNCFPEPVNAAFRAAKKDGGITIEDSVLWDHEYLIMGGEDLNVDTTEGLDDDLTGATKGKLKAAFGKASNNKLKTRVVLRKFSEMIAA